MSLDLLSDMSFQLVESLSRHCIQNCDFISVIIFSSINIISSNASSKCIPPQTNPRSIRSTKECSPLTHHHVILSALRQLTAQRCQIDTCCPLPTSARCISGSRIVQLRSDWNPGGCCLGQSQKGPSLAYCPVCTK